MTDIQTESDAYEPTVHKHRCAQKGHLDLYQVSIMQTAILLRNIRFADHIQTCLKHYVKFDMSQERSPIDLSTQK